MVKITKRALDAFGPATDRESFLWDSEVKGFGVRFQPSGIGTYVLKYRTADGRQRKLALGRINTITPDEARALAKRRMAEVAAGGDPSGERKAARAAITVSEMCDWYLREADAGRLLGRGRKRIKSSTLAMDRSRIDTHVRPLIGRISIQALTTADVRRMQADIIAGRTAKKRKADGRGGVASGGEGVAARTTGMLATIIEHARAELDMPTTNVARGVKRPADKKVERFLSPEEIGRLGRAMRVALAAGESECGLAAIRFLLLSGCRRSEALGLPLAWVDRNASCLRLGDSKTGAQIRPIGKAAFGALHLAPSNKEWVFPSQAGSGHFVGLPRVVERLASRAEISGLTPHILRHTFASVAAGLGYSELTIAGLLGHAARGVTQRYSHLPDASLVAAADAISVHIATLLDADEEGSRAA